MKINKLLTMLGILLLTLSLTPKAVSQPYPEYEQEWFWSIPAFAPARININYVYTHNHSIRDISCLGATSLYRHSGGPENILFEADDFDTYSYTVELFYKDITYQHLTVGIWSGVQQVQPVYEYDFFTMHITIHVTLMVTQEPKFPTAEETAEATLDRLERTWINYTKTLEATVRKQERTMLILEIGVMVSTVMSIASAGVVVSMRRKR